MYTQKLILGVVPVKRSFLSMEEAVRQKNKFMSVIRRVKPELVEIVDVDDIAEQGILYEADKVPAVVDKLKKRELMPCSCPSAIWGGTGGSGSGGSLPGARAGMGSQG